MTPMRVAATMFAGLLLVVTGCGGSPHAAPSSTTSTTLKAAAVTSPSTTVVGASTTSGHRHVPESAESRAMAAKLPTAVTGYVLQPNAYSDAGPSDLGKAIDDSRDQAERKGLESGLPDSVGLAHPGTHIVNQAFALIEAGRLEEAGALSVAGYEIAIADRIPIAQIWFALMLGKVHLLRGRVLDSRMWHRESASTARLHSFRGPLRLAVAGGAVAEALLGNVAAAASAIEELDSLPEFTFLAYDQAIGRAWAAVADNRPADARSILLAEADRAASVSNRASAAWLLHDAARLGAADVGPRLRSLSERSDSALIDVRATHVTALEAGGASALADASRQLEQIGLDLVAAEAAGLAADAYRRAGVQRAAAREAGRSAELVARCQGARTPGVAALPGVVPLTAREREVAALAAGGLTSKMIAERLFLSVRTVDNHLQRTYTKLGIAGRSELSAVYESN